MLFCCQNALKNKLMDSLEEKIKINDKKRTERTISIEDKLPIGTKVLWLLNKKEYTKINTEKPFSRWESLNGGVLMIDDDRVLRKDVFEVLNKKEDK